MKRWTPGALLGAAGLVAGAAWAAPAVTGDYVESRSANVFVGACHHEGEIVASGRDAVMAWNVQSGEHRGVSLAGLRAAAVVVGDRHLELDAARRESVIYVDSAASAEQKEALVALLREKAASALGEVRDVKSADIAFDAKGDQYRVQIAGVALMKIKKQTAELCCKQPYEIWGRPFVSVKDAKAGYCLGVDVKEPSLKKAWTVSDQNNAFFGQFRL